MDRELAARLQRTYAACLSRGVPTQTGGQVITHTRPGRRIVTVPPVTTKNLRLPASDGLTARGVCESEMVVGVGGQGAWC